MKLVILFWNYQSYIRGELDAAYQPRPLLLAIAGDPGIRLRDIVTTLGITERSACAIVTGLTEAGYAAKQREGRHNRYQIQARLPLPGPAS